MKVNNKSFMIANKDGNIKVVPAKDFTGTCSKWLINNP